MIFDSHAHYDDDSFDEDREKVIEEIHNNGVIAVLNCGASFQGAKDSVKLAEKYDFFYAAVGIHPENAYELTDETLKEIREMTKNPKVKAIGEIGLDYYWEENPPKDVQKEVFRKQMALAKDLGLPVVIHDREAHGDTLEIMKEFPEVKGVVHCFSGSVEFARECLKLGYYIGFTGVITFKNAKKIIEVAKEVPMDRILVETDAPYMAPTPHRGKRNQSDYIKFIIEKIAEIKEVSPGFMENLTINNAKNLLKIKS
ncbi:TatD family hydrolase [Clostridium thermopalmarium]|uniref:Putative deoxyribonuclease YcfH n=1 Tax=Clostridium thermopalmarium DSM 5974 TaxID=1121340 RepID=A0A2T0ARQ1_9CLOT|nr:TatD family hydrolase [Clostridium thermopalmarium]MBE6043933.1 TatD family deoxyribonuclease [Clostridium thermopalmarium]PRR72081.1 putative deoxyribonuclease YcfH [Clostridium thermopalmarium DSM 5974]PVZ23734.1 TatD DNase family protein [Clostridium thermopalmarium DSM 5974]